MLDAGPGLRKLDTRTLPSPPRTFLFQEDHPTGSRPTPLESGANPNTGLSRWPRRLMDTGHNKLLV